MRIQKYLSEKNILSRRAAERAIQDGKISVNGTIVTTMGFQIDPEKDQITVHDTLLQKIKNSTLIAYYKPIGIVTTSPETGERCIQDILPKKYRHLFPIGRLDKDSEGLILLTDNGIWAKELLNTETPHPRVYEVTLHAAMTPSQKQQLEKGIVILGKKTKPVQIERLNPASHIRITMIEGRNRQIRRMMKHVGLVVTSLKRIQFGSYQLGKLKPQELREEQFELNGR